TAYHSCAALVATVLLTWLSAGCMVGPNYKEPATPLLQEWSEPGHPSVQRGEAELTHWWKAFDDPVLDELVERAYRDSPPLHAAAVRVLQAQAARAIAIGLLFPQQQEAAGS